MSNFKMVIAYDGSPFSGWQIQPNGFSIQALIQEALFKILKKPITLIAAGRTDAGVHAKGQVAHFTYDGLCDRSKLQYSLNGILPPEIRILSIEDIEASFHARFSAKRKIYHYNLTQGKVHDPFTRNFTLHINYPLNLGDIQKAITYLIGSHNFKAFANESYKGSALHDPIKTLYAIRIKEAPPHLCFEFEGSGFLYKMVRNLMGTLLECGKGKISPLDVKCILESQDRKKAHEASPAQGLCLYKVIYD